MYHSSTTTTRHLRFRFRKEFYPKGKPIEHSKTPNAVCSYVVVSANGRAIGPAYGKTSLH